MRRFPISLGRLVLAVGLAFSPTAVSLAAGPATTEFTYQGQLTNAGSPVVTACDFRFMLFDNATGGSQVGGTLQLNNTAPTQGRLRVGLDFGLAAFEGQARWLEIRIRNPAGSGMWITLSPRQPITATPFALYALSGNAGPQGPAGAQGPQGSAGPAGLTGAQGPQGETGPVGPSGPIGPQGTQGETGAAGPQGPQGEQGLPGQVGQSGPSGEQGPSGDPGPAGMDGAPGPDLFCDASSGTAFGTPAHLETTIVFDAENVNTGGPPFHDADNAAHAFVATTAGTYAFDLIARFDVPSSGSKEFRAYVNGDFIDLLADSRGSSVASASWQIRLEPNDSVEITYIDHTGFTIVESARVWVSLLTTGQQGLTGDQGVQGAQGETGAQGIQGVVGPAGPQGDQGDAGPAGAQGDVGPQGPEGPAGTTDWNGLTNVPAGFFDGIDHDTTYSAGPGLQLSGSEFAITDGGIVTAMLGEGQVTAAKIANRVRKVVLSPGSFATGGSAGSGSAQFSVGDRRRRGAAVTLPNDADNVATATFVVPSDFASGQGIPKLTAHWATDESGGSRQVDCDIGFVKIGDLTGPGADVTFRYNFRASSGGSTNAMDSINPDQSQVVAQTVPEGSESYDNSPAAWAAGDVIVISVGRNGASGSDPSEGNMYLYAVTFEYEADQ